ncbi:ribosome maturation factor RimM [Clostridia bacterium OttesenSCG-928-O13]|nr:ribosome maturation factor RimM [Clostridia bacterium OttesenSCG-928-O13]
MKSFLEAGEFVTTHGISGELRLYPWCDDPAFLCDFATLYLDEAGQTPLPIADMRPHKNICIAKLSGVDSIEAARPYIGKTVYIARADAHLPEGRHFVQDLLGAQVVDADTGQVYGTISAITHPGRHEVYEVARPNGGTALFPATEPFLVAAFPEEGRVLVRPIPGMFDEETAPPKTRRRKNKGATP